MCTVSFVSVNNKVIITSNRDEQVARPAMAPQSYLINNKTITFPKDPKAGGTWYAIDENANVLVLLNGSAEKHIWNPPYKRSRGLIVLEVISQTSPVVFWDTIDLDEVEPFTLVLFENRALYQLRWNGTVKDKQILDPAQNHIWSSSTLYAKDIRAQRAEWFHTFLDTNPFVTEAEMLDFHRYTENDNQQNGLVINRNDSLKTLSITQTVIEKNKMVLLYSDLINQNDFSNSFLIV